MDNNLESTNNEAKNQSENKGDTRDYLNYESDKELPIIKQNLKELKEKLKQSHKPKALQRLQLEYQHMINKK